MVFENRFIKAHAFLISLWVLVVTVAAVVRVSQNYAYVDSGENMHDPEMLRRATANYSLQLFCIFVLVGVQVMIII